MTREEKIKVIREICGEMQGIFCRKGVCPLDKAGRCGFSSLPDDAIDMAIRLIGEKKANTDGRKWRNDE